MHIINKAMKLFSFLFTTLLLVNTILIAQAPTDWVVGTQYNSGVLVEYNNNFYKAIQDIPGSVGGTPDTLTDYWVDIFSTKPDTEPGDPPNTEGPGSDSDLGNLTPPVDSSTINSRFLGISTRGPVSKTVGMTGAVAVTGSGTKKVAFMAKGTTMLATDSTINVVKDPNMIIFQNDGSGWTVLGENDNHADADASKNISTVSGKEGITLPVGANEAAIVVDVQPGVSYAAIVTEQDTTIGDTEVREAIVEAYEISEDGSTSQARFLGISTRGPISKTVSMTGAVAVTGTGAKKVAFMAKGTTMLSTDSTINVVKDPKMIIYQNDGSGWTVLGENDNHADASASQNISTVSGKEGITLPIGVNEAAIVVNVQPGVSYAAIVTEQDTTIGSNEVREAIVEAYEITE